MKSNLHVRPPLISDQRLFKTPKGFPVTALHLDPLVSNCDGDRFEEGSGEGDGLKFSTVLTSFKLRLDSLTFHCMHYRDYSEYKSNFQWQHEITDIIT